MTEDNVNKMRVILCRPGEKAETIGMEDSLEAMQKMVGGRKVVCQDCPREQATAQLDWMQSTADRRPGFVQR